MATLPANGACKPQVSRSSQATSFRVCTEQILCAGHWACEQHPRQAGAAVHPEGGRPPARCGASQRGPERGGSLRGAECLEKKAHVQEGQPEPGFGRCLTWWAGGSKVKGGVSRPEGGDGAWMALTQAPGRGVGPPAVIPRGSSPPLPGADLPEKVNKGLCLQRCHVEEPARAGAHPEMEASSWWRGPQHKGRKSLCTFLATPRAAHSLPSEPGGPLLAAGGRTRLLAGMAVPDGHDGHGQAGREDPEPWFCA